MKIKNLKLMLLGLIGLMSASNVFAASHFSFLPGEGQKKTKDGVTYQIKAAADIVKDETGRSVNNIVYDLYTIKWTAVTGTANFTTKEAFVVGVNGSAADTEVATLAIPAKVTGDKGEYDVVEVADNWKSADGMKNVTTLTKTLSVDITNFKTETEGTDPVKEKTGQPLATKVYELFKKLESLTITDTYAATAEAPARYTVFNGGFGEDAQKTLQTASLEGSNITTIGEGAFGSCTALTGFNFGTKITSIGANAFKGCCSISELTIPATVTSIGNDAFSGMYKAKDGDTPATGLKTLIINGANNTYKTDGTIEKSKIPAAFKDNGLLESVTIGSTTATEIVASAFAKSSLTYDAAIKVIDLSGATALATIGENAFPTGCPLETVKLEGTKLTDATPEAQKICTIDLSAAHQTLATLTFPATYTALAVGQFKDFVALSEVDLSKTKVTDVKDMAFQITGAEKDKDGKAIKPTLTKVALNEATTAVRYQAFEGQESLATVTGLNQDKLELIGANVFNKTALTAVELDKATNSKFTSIYALSFGNIATLTSIKLPAQINVIETAAFANDAKVASINLQDTKITVLNPIFHEGIVGALEPSSESEEIAYGYKATDVTSKEVAIALTSVTLPEGLIKVAPGALQLLDITEINIPATVTSVGAYALQGCVKLKNFIWDEALSRTIYNNAFRGDDHMEKVKMVTSASGYEAGINIAGKTTTGDPIDLIFKGNNKDVLKFIVNDEDRAVLEAKGWTVANLQYCTLTSNEASMFAFKAAGECGEYYYATFYNAKQAAWFDANVFDVFTAEVQGSEVVLVPAETENGFYKVAKYDETNDAAAVCVIRAKKENLNDKLEAEYQLKNASFNDLSTLDASHNDLEVNDGAAFAPSRIKYQYKFGAKGGKVAFYRVTSGEIKKGGIYIESHVAADRLDIVFQGEEATAIKGINAAEKNDGAIYNLNGMRVNKAQKGIYIQNGKKYVVK